VGAHQPAALSVLVEVVEHGEHGEQWAAHVRDLRFDTDFVDGPGELLAALHLAADVLNVEATQIVEEAVNRLGIDGSSAG
jgi:hypothetical protein